jgi:hypothetical protein
MNHPPPTPDFPGDAISIFSKFTNTYATQGAPPVSISNGKKV